MRVSFVASLPTLARVFLALGAIFFSVSCTQIGSTSSQTHSPKTLAINSQLNAGKIKQPLSVDGEIDSVWATATPLVFNTNWRGEVTPSRTQVRALWSQDALYLLWELDSAGLHNTDHVFSRDQERNKLYDEDCVELFIAPDPAAPYQYAEIEVGPYGHYMDLWVDRRMKSHDSSWSSNLSVATKQQVSDKRVVIEMAIRASDITRALVAGAQLPIGLYRLEGAKPRQYLAAFPTHTKSPNFHVPEAFGSLVLNP